MKGPSFQYGNTKNSPTSHINYPYAKDFDYHNIDNHVANHATQMKAKNKDEYVSKAVTFANKVDRNNCLSFVDKKGSTYKYNIKTNELAIITSDGYVVTYFKPQKGRQYYEDQIKKHS